MAKNFKEIGKKAEALMEQGREADQRVQSCQARLAAAGNQVAAARRQLAAASETDEEGNPAGNVEQARVQLGMAENQLAASQRALAAAQSDAEHVRLQKNDHVREIEQHNRVERSNLEKLRKLKSGPFAADSAALTEGMAQRLNEAENARVALLRSMGIEATPDYVNVDGEGGADSKWSGGGFSSIDTSGETQSFRGGETAGKGSDTGIKALLTGGLGGLLNRIFNTDGERNSKSKTANAHGAENVQYTSIDELSDDVYKYATDYVEHAAKYNDPLRAHQTTAEVEHFRDLINSHRTVADSAFFRRASLADFGSKLATFPPEELVGRCYQFEGIMSVAENEKYAGSLNDGTDATFEIRVPAGTQGLDLTKVPTFYQAMFDSPFCYIESATKKEGSNSTHFVVRMLSAGEGLNRANDYTSLEKYMNLKYSIGLDESIGHLSFDTVKSSIGGVESVINDYPDVGKFLESGITSQDGIMSCNGSKLSFNPEYFSDDKKLHNTCRDMSNSGFWVSNASTTSIGAHEAAHGVEWALIQANPQYKSEQEKISAWNNCSEASIIVRSACANIKSTEYGRGKTDTDLVRAISTYALKDYSEAMAEGFADVYANGDNAKPLSKEIKRLTSVLMNKYKGGI